MPIRRNGPFDDMALDEMVLYEMSCSQNRQIILAAHPTLILNLDFVKVFNSFLMQKLKMHLNVNVS